MTADVSSGGRNPNALITQDLLAGLSRPGKNSDHHLDFMSRQSYFHGTHFPITPLSSSSSSGDHRKQRIPSPAPEIQDLNYPPTTSLELTLESSSSSESTRSNYESVCTLEKVKSALQRAEQGTIKKRPSEPKMTSSDMFAAACPGCLLYVITQKTNPSCPRCCAAVPCPPPAKKARIDLNSMQQFV